MKKFWKKKERAVKPDSPDDGELLAYLDGALAPERQAEIRQLLASDWRLRVRLAEVERFLRPNEQAMPALIAEIAAVFQANQP